MASGRGVLIACLSLSPFESTLKRSRKQWVSGRCFGEQGERGEKLGCIDGPEYRVRRGADEILKDGHALPVPGSQKRVNKVSRGFL